MAAAAISFASMMADAADEHEHLFGARREGLYYAGWAFASKAAQGFGSLTAGIALQAIGFKSGGEAAAAAAQLSPATIDWIGAIYGPGASLVALLAAVNCLFYRLNAKKHAHILTELDQRRAERSSPPAHRSPHDDRGRRDRLRHDQPRLSRHDRARARLWSYARLPAARWPRPRGRRRVMAVRRCRSRHCSPILLSISSSTLRRPPCITRSVAAYCSRGKHLYSEKPFATTLPDAHDLIALADAQGLGIGCAPDTFLGAGHQTARRLIDDGAIGRVTGGSIAFGTAGMESWHPDPAFFYAAGGGPLLDIGPYYGHAACQPDRSCGGGRRDRHHPACHAHRHVAGPHGRDYRGESRPASPAPAVREWRQRLARFSWDGSAHRRPPIELYGDGGTMSVPDPISSAAWCAPPATATTGTKPATLPAAQARSRDARQRRSGDDARYRSLTGGPMGPDST